MDAVSRVSALEFARRFDQLQRGVILHKWSDRYIDGQRHGTEDARRLCGGEAEK